MLGIKSHKLSPALFLEGRSDSEGNRLEIYLKGRVVRLAGGTGRWTTLLSRWFLGAVTIQKSGSVQSAPEIHSHPLHLLVPRS